MRRRALLLTLALAVACERSASAPPERAGATATPAARAAPAATAPAAAAASPAASPVAVLPADEVARLKALGYVDVSEDVVEAQAMGVVRRDPQRSQPGYNLFTNAHLCSTQIVDEHGAVVHSWSTESCFRWDNTVLLEDGDLLAVGRDGERSDSRWSEGHYLARFSWDGELRWKRRINAHHDAQPTPEGGLSVLTGEDRVLPEIDPERPMKVDALAVLDQDGRIVEQASLYELLRTAPGGFDFVARPAGQHNPDLIHANSIDWMRRPELAAKSPLYALSNVLVCMRHQDAIAMIDWERKEVVWTWGRGVLSGPHDAQVLDNGNVLVFDNGIERKASRVLEVDPLSGRIVWQYQAEDPQSFFTLTRGSSQRLANGNTLIADSDSGRAFEVDPSGDVVWEFLNPNLWEGKRGAIVRMRRLDRGPVDRLLAAKHDPGSSAGAGPAGGG